MKDDFDDVSLSDGLGYMVDRKRFEAKVFAIRRVAVQGYFGAQITKIPFSIRDLDLDCQSTVYRRRQPHG